MFKVLGSISSTTKERKDSWGEEKDLPHQGQLINKERMMEAEKPAFSNHHSKTGFR